MKAAVIINQGAFAALHGNEKCNPDNIQSSLQKYNIESEIFAVKGEELEKTAKSAMAMDINLIIAAGGDGTVSTVAAVLTGSNIPMGVLPIGTLNHFAKDAGIPLEFDDAIKTIANQNIKQIDVGEVNGIIFVNNSSIGLYPKVVKHREKEINSLGGRKWVAMGIAVLRMFKRFPTVNVKIKTGGKMMECKTPFVFVGNNNYNMDIFNLGTRKELDKGCLGVYYPNTTNRFEMLKFAILGLMNKLSSENNFSIYFTDELTLETKKKYIDVSTDGEVLKLSTPLNYKLRKHALKVIIPGKE